MTHLFDHSIWLGRWEIRRVTIGLLFDAPSNTSSELKWVILSRRASEEGSCKVEEIHSEVEDGSSPYKRWAYSVGDSRTLYVG